MCSRWGEGGGGGGQFSESKCQFTDRWARWGREKEDEGWKRKCRESDRKDKRVLFFLSFLSPPHPPSSLSCICLFCSASRTVVIIMACTHCTDTSLSWNNPNVHCSFHTNRPATPFAATPTSFVVQALMAMCTPSAERGSSRSARGASWNGGGRPQCSPTLLPARGRRLRQVPTTALHLQRWAAWS